MEAYNTIAALNMSLDNAVSLSTPHTWYQAHAAGFAAGVRNAAYDVAWPSDTAEDYCAGYRDGLLASTQF